jgi:hypothetical protein
MTGGNGRLTEMRHGYATLLQKKELTLPKHRPNLVRWVKVFLVFAKARLGDTLRIHRYQYRATRVLSGSITTEAQTLTTVRKVWSLPASPSLAAPLRSSP